METEAHNRDQRNPEDGQDTLPKPLVYQIRKNKKKTWRNFLIYVTYQN